MVKWDKVHAPTRITSWKFNFPTLEKDKKKWENFGSRPTRNQSQMKIKFLTTLFVLIAMFFLETPFERHFTTHVVSAKWGAYLDDTTLKNGFRKISYTGYKNIK